MTYEYTMIINRYPPLETIRLQTNDLFPIHIVEQDTFFHVVAAVFGEDENPSDLYIRWADIESVEQYNNG